MLLRENGLLLALSLGLSCVIWIADQDAYCFAQEKSPLRLMSLNETRPTDLAWNPVERSSHVTLTWKTPIDFGYRAKAKSRCSYETNKKADPGSHFESQSHTKGVFQP